MRSILRCLGISLLLACTEPTAGRRIIFDVDTPSRAVTAATYAELILASLASHWSPPRRIRVSGLEVVVELSFRSFGLEYQDAWFDSFIQRMTAEDSGLFLRTGSRTIRRADFELAKLKTIDGLEFYSFSTPTGGQLKLDKTVEIHIEDGNMILQRPSQQNRLMPSNPGNQRELFDLELYKLMQCVNQAPPGGIRWRYTEITRFRPDDGTYADLSFVNKDITAQKAMDYSMRCRI